MKDYLTFENARNKANQRLYAALLQQALGKDAHLEVLVGHHVTFETGNDLATENEIPSADTLMFDHDIMNAVFGNKAVDVMQHLAATPVASRDTVLETYFNLVVSADPDFVQAGGLEDAGMLLCPGDMVPNDR